RRKDRSGHMIARGLSPRPAASMLLTMNVGTLNLATSWRASLIGLSHAPAKSIEHLAPVGARLHLRTDLLIDRRLAFPAQLPPAAKRAVETDQIKRDGPPG